MNRSSLLFGRGSPEISSSKIKAGSMPWLAASVRDAERKDQKIISSMNLMWFSWEERRGEECDRLRRGRSRALPSRTFLSFSFPSAFKGTGHLSVRVDGSQGRTGGGDEAMGRSGPGRIRPASAPTFSLSMAVWKAVWKKGLEGGCLRRLRHPFDSRKVIPRALT